MTIEYCCVGTLKSKTVNVLILNGYILVRVKHETMISTFYCLPLHYEIKPIVISFSVKHHNLFGGGF